MKKKRQSLDEMFREVAATPDFERNMREMEITLAREAVRKGWDHPALLAVTVGG